MGSGLQWWPWVHIDDVAGIARAALADERFEGPVNVAAPQPERQRAVARALGRAVHRPAFLPAPGFALKLLLGAFAEELLGSRNVEPERATALGYAFRYPRLEPALADLIR
jgi:NAD dependent epimerase/dehydratase family enzyme